MQSPAVLLLALLCICSHGGAGFPAKKAGFSRRKRAPQKPSSLGSPGRVLLLAVAQGRAACSDSGQASLPLLPVSPILLVPVQSSLPSGMLRPFLAGNGRISYMSVDKTAGAAQLVLLHHILHHLPCTSLRTISFTISYHPTVPTSLTPYIF